MVKIAALQISPILFDREQSLDKAVSYIHKAGDEDVDIVLFPESFIPGYPRGLSFGYLVGSRTEKGREDYLRYYRNSVKVPGKITEKIGKAAKENEVYVIIGVTERGAQQNNYTLYCTLLYFGPSGKYLGKHQKLKPTGAERLIWGEGYSNSLITIKTPFGVMGGLICWENYMPLARMAMYKKGVTIYLAPTADARESWQTAIKHIGKEGRCFVISCNQFVTKDMYPKDLNYYYELEDKPNIICPGGSAIVNPKGEYLIEPVFNKEKMLIATLDMDMIIKEKMDFDVNGHYNRPDLFEFNCKFPN